MKRANWSSTTVRGSFCRRARSFCPPGNYEAGRGVFYSEILRVEGDSAKTVILLPPRYRGHEEEVAKIYNFAGTRDVGIRAAWAWFKSLFGGKTRRRLNHRGHRLN